MSRGIDDGEDLVELDQMGARANYVVDKRYLVENVKEQEDIEITKLKTASDGHTILVPRPTDDPNDPLNWSSLRKRLMLIIISYTAFLPDFGNSIGAIALVPQSE